MEKELKQIFRNFKDVKVSNVNLMNEKLTVRVMADNHVMEFSTKTSCNEISDDLIIQCLRTHERRIQSVHIE